MQPVSQLGRNETTYPGIQHRKLHLAGHLSTSLTYGSGDHNQGNKACWCMCVVYTEINLELGLHIYSQFFSKFENKT